MPKPKVIAIVGPTSSGKSALGKFLAQKLEGEIISADSRQVYKGMRTISRAEKGHMVGVADPRRRYSTGQYVRDAQKVIVNIVKRGKLPIVVGGAGFYTDPLLRGWLLPHVAPDKKLRTQLEAKTPAQLLVLLKKLDKKSAARVDPHNKVRLIRAIEIAKTLGKVPPLTEDTRYNTLWLGLGEAKNLPAGVESRLRRGMVAEAKKLRTSLSKRRYAQLGFEFTLLAEFLDKKISKKELVQRITNGERKYAIRQMRWFKRYKDITWIKNNSEALQRAKKFLCGR